MRFSLDQLEFLGAHTDIIIPTKIVENKRSEVQFQKRRAQSISENDLKALHNAEAIQAALATADELARSEVKFTEALQQLDEVERLVQIPPPLPPDEPPEKPADKPPDPPQQLGDASVPDTETLKAALVEATKAVDESLIALQDFDNRITAARQKVGPMAALTASHPKLDFAADEKRMTDLIARAVKAATEQPAVLKQLQAEITSAKDILAGGDATVLKALAANIGEITRKAKSAVKTVLAASRMLENIDAGVKFVQKSAAEADKLIARLNAIQIPVVQDMLARAGLIPKIDASGADVGQQEILKQLVFAVNLPAAKIEKEILTCKNVKTSKKALEKLRKAGKSSDEQRATLAQCHSLVNDVFRLYRELAPFKEGLDDSQKIGFDLICTLAKTEYTLGMVASVEATDDARDVKQPRQGKQIQKKEDLLTPDPKIKSKLVGVMGGGPVGLLAAIETAMRGGKVLMFESRGGDSGKELYNRLNTIKLHDGTIQRLQKVGVWNDVLAKMDQGAHAVPVGALETILLARANSFGVKFNEGKTVTNAVRSKDGKTVTLTVDGDDKPVVVQLLVVAAGAGFAKGGDKVSMAEKFGFEVVKAEAKDYAVTGAFDPNSADRGGAKKGQMGWAYGFNAPEVTYSLSQLTEKEYGELARDPVKLEAFVRQAAINKNLGNRDFKKGATGNDVKPAAFPIEIQQARNMTSSTSGAVLVGDSAATPHPSTAMGLNTGSREIDAISDLVGATGDEDEALAAYDWETTRNTNVMVAMAMATMVDNAASRCATAKLKIFPQLDNLGTPVAKQIRPMIEAVLQDVVEPLKAAAKNDDGADDWKLSSTNIKLMREIEEKLVAVLELTKPGGNLDDAPAILDGITGTSREKSPKKTGKSGHSSAKPSRSKPKSTRKTDRKK